MRTIALTCRNARQQIRHYRWHMNMRITIRSLIVTLFVLAGGLAFNLQAAHADHVITQIGRASCRERV